MPRIRVLFTFKDPLIPATEGDLLVDVQQVLREADPEHHIFEIEHMEVL